MKLRLPRWTVESLPEIREPTSARLRRRTMVSPLTPWNLALVLNRLNR